MSKLSVKYQAKDPQAKKLQLSTTCFLRCADEYLFIFRNKNPHKVDYLRLNGLGGKLEPGESFLGCALREIEEETGYQIKPAQSRFLGTGQLSGGYESDWLVGFFEMEVATKEIPIGRENAEGELVWLKADQLLSDRREKVDDLNHIWPQILDQAGVTFFVAELDENEKVKKLDWLSSS